MLYSHFTCTFVKNRTHTHVTTASIPVLRCYMCVCVYNDDADRDDEATTTTLYLRYKTFVVG